MRRKCGKMRIRKSKRKSSKGFYSLGWACCNDPLGISLEVGFGGRRFFSDALGIVRFDSCVQEIIGWVDFGVICRFGLLVGLIWLMLWEMNDWLGQLVLGQMENAGGWDQLVRSMRGAIEDRSHVVHLGIGVGVILVVWINWKLAKWILGHFESPKEGM